MQNLTKYGIIVPVILIASLVMIAGIKALEYRTIYNPYTGKLDFYALYTGTDSLNASNITVTYNVTAPYFLGNISCTNIYGGTDDDFCVDLTGAGGAGMWIDGGTFLYPNATFASNVNITGWLTLWAESNFYANLIIHENVTIKKNLTVEENITASYLFGDLNASYILNPPWQTGTELDTQKNASGYLYNDTTTIYLNDTQLNDTIDARELYNSTTDILTVTDLYGYYNFSYEIGWSNLTAYPSACSAGEAITQLADSPTCSAFQTGSELYNSSADILNVVENNLYYNFSYEFGWANLTAYPSACTSGQYVHTIGDTLTCSLPSYTTDTNASTICSGENVLTGNGNCVVNYNSTTDMINAVNNTDINVTYFWNYVASDFILWTDAIPWTNLTSYPSACSAGQAVTQIDDTLTCSAFQTGSEQSNTTEEMQDAVMAAIDDGTQTRITVTYQDGTNDMDFVVDDMIEYNTSAEMIVATTGLVNSTAWNYSYDGENVTTAYNISMSTGQKMCFGPVCIWYNGSSLIIH